MLHFVLVDDNPEHHHILSGRLTEICLQMALEAQIDLMTADYHQALEYAKNASEEEITIYFVDIELQQYITGVELSRRIRSIRPSDYVVFVSAYQQYALQCCRAHAFDFLLKPLLPEQLRDCIEAIWQDICFRRQGTMLEIPMGTKQVLLRQEDIVYFYKERANLNAVCQQGNTVTWRESLNDLKPRLAGNMFVQCHKSYIVNRRYVQEYSWSEDKLVLKNGETLPISRRKTGELKEIIAKDGY